MRTVISTNTRATVGSGHAVAAAVVVEALEAIGNLDGEISGAAATHGAEEPMVTKRQIKKFRYNLW